MFLFDFFEREVVFEDEMRCFDSNQVLVVGVELHCFVGTDSIFSGYELSFTPGREFLVIFFVFGFDLQ